MKEFFINLYNDLAAVFTARIGLLDILDIIIVTVIIYLILRITKETRARQVLKGLGIVIIMAAPFGYKLAALHAAAMGSFNSSYIVPA